MTTPDKQLLSLEEFSIFLETHGADTDRWPEDMLAPVENLLAGDGTARRCLVEARAFESVLHNVSQHNQRVAADANAALADKIVAAALRDEATGVTEPDAGKIVIDDTSVVADNKPVVADNKPVVADNRNVINWPGSAAPSSGNGKNDRPVMVPLQHHSVWRSAALLAASLVLGIYIGFSANGLTTTQVLAEVASLASSGQSAQAIIEIGDLSDLDEEAL